jgi:hypothetical protein
MPEKSQVYKITDVMTKIESYLKITSMRKWRKRENEVWKIRWKQEWGYSVKCRMRLLCKMQNGAFSKLPCFQAS